MLDINKKTVINDLYRMQKTRNILLLLGSNKDSLMEQVYTPCYEYLLKTYAGFAVCIFQIR